MLLSSQSLHFLHRYVNVYHGYMLPLHQTCYDYLISPEYFKTTHEANSIYNRVPCDLYTAMVRNGYAFGDLQHVSILKKNHLQSIYDIIGQCTGYIDPTHKIFYPSMTAQRGMVARGLLHLFHEHPYLYSHLPSIVADVNLLSDWKQYPITLYEKELHHRTLWKKKW